MSSRVRQDEPPGRSRQRLIANLNETPRPACRLNFRLTFLSFVYFGKRPVLLDLCIADGYPASSGDFDHSCHAETLHLFSPFGDRSHDGIHHAVFRDVAHDLSLCIVGGGLPRHAAQEGRQLVPLRKCEFHQADTGSRAIAATESIGRLQNCHQSKTTSAVERIDTYFPSPRTRWSRRRISAILARTATRASSGTSAGSAARSINSRGISSPPRRLKLFLSISVTITIQSLCYAFTNRLHVVRNVIIDIYTPEPQRIYTPESLRIQFSQTVRQKLRKGL